MLPNGEEKPITYGSRTLSKTEQNYAQVEKEAIAIIFGIRKFHQYTFNYNIHTKAGLPVLAAARLQRWAIMLSAYQYDIEFRPTNKHSNADCSSRLPLSTQASAEQDNAASLFNIHQIGTLPIGTDRLRQQTNLDPALAKVTVCWVAFYSNSICM